MSQGPWNKKRNRPMDHALPISSVAATQVSDLAVRQVGPTQVTTTLKENCESLLGLFDAKSLNDAVVASGWTLAEELQILTDIVRGEPYHARGESGDVEVMTVDPRTRLAAQKQLRTFLLEIATLNGVVRRMTSDPEEGSKVSVTVKGDTDGVMQLLQRKHSPSYGGVIDVTPEPQKAITDGTHDSKDECSETPEAGGAPEAPAEEPTAQHEPGAVA